MEKILRGRLFRLVCVFLLLCLPASAQILRIRVINARSGQPLPKQLVFVNLIYDHNQKPPSDIELNLHLSTGADGTTTFPLPATTPEHLWVQVKLTPDNWRCGCYALADTQDVIRRGLAPSGSLKPPSAVDANAKPAEILFTARPPTFFERIFDPLLRE